MNKKAVYGYDMTLIMIAVIVVSAIVGIALIYAANKESQTAKEVGYQGTSGMGENIIPTEIKVELENEAVKYYYVTAKLSNNQIGLDYNLMSVILREPTNVSVLNYDNSSENCSDMTVGEDEYFRIDPVLKGKRYTTGMLNQYDVIEICFTSATLVREDDEVEFIFSSSDGAMKTIKSTIPFSMQQEIMRIYP